MITSALLCCMALGLLPGYQVAVADAGLVHWESREIPYRIHVAGSADLDDGSDIDAVKASFDAWSGLPCANFRFRFDGLSEATEAGQADDPRVNLVVWREDPAAWIELGYSPLYYAVTTLSFSRRTAALEDADIEVNGGYHTWTTDDAIVSVDVRNVLTHEVGHVVGLDHSAYRDAVMYRRAAAGETSKRALTDDDIAGVCFLYPPPDEDPPWSGQHDDEGGGCALGEGRGGATAPLLLLGAWIALVAVCRVRRTEAGPRRGDRMPRIPTGGQA